VARDAIERALTDGAVDRILEAVGAQYIPDKLDREALFGDIESAASVHHTGQALRIKPAKREEDARRIQTALAHAEELFFKYIADHEALHLHPNIPRLRNMIDAVSKENEPRPVLNKVLGFKQQASVSPFENLIGNLRWIFETHFARDAGYSKDLHTGAVGGPFIRFAGAVLQEVGIFYEIKSIASAVDKLRRLNPVK
jgi:hypothetical protein